MARIASGAGWLRHSGGALGRPVGRPAMSRKPGLGDCQHPGFARHADEKGDKAVSFPLHIRSRPRYVARACQAVRSWRNW
ncbi:MAG: hypothetical protein Kow0013_02260 [Pararhodobacter sp.]